MYGAYYYKPSVRCVLHSEGHQLCHTLARAILPDSDASTTKIDQAVDSVGLRLLQHLWCPSQLSAALSSS